MRKGKYDGILLLWPEEIVTANNLSPRAHCYTANWAFLCAQRHACNLHRPRSQLKGRNGVGVARGYDYPKDSIMNPELSARKAVDDLTNLRKLAAGRFNLVLLEHQVGLHLLSRDTRNC